MKLLSYYINTRKTLLNEIINWREHYITDNLCYAFRKTEYTPQTYPANLHYHDYYEIVIYLYGDIQYICESNVWKLQYGDIVLIPPKKLHMSEIMASHTYYIRHVFYLNEEAFSAIGCEALTAFMVNHPMGGLLSSLQHAERQELLNLLDKLDPILMNNTPAEQALALGYILQAFYIMNRADYLHTGSQTLPSQIVDILQYIDTNYTQINTVAEVAAHFFYSREYVSRLFRKHLNTTIADYIMQRRVAFSQSLIAQGMALSDVCFEAGFGSSATFIRAFRSITNLVPSQYRRLINGSGELPSNTR